MGVRGKAGWITRRDNRYDHGKAPGLIERRASNRSRRRFASTAAAQDRASGHSEVGGFALEAHRRSPLAATDMLQNLAIMNIEASL
jgi:hypothetical protein